MKKKNGKTVGSVCHAKVFEEFPRFRGEPIHSYPSICNISPQLAAILNLENFFKIKPPSNKKHPKANPQKTQGGGSFRCHKKSGMGRYHELYLFIFRAKTKHMSHCNCKCQNRKPKQLPPRKKKKHTWRCISNHITKLIHFHYPTLPHISQQTLAPTPHTSQRKITAGGSLGYQPGEDQLGQSTEDPPIFHSSDPMEELMYVFTIGHGKSSPYNWVFE